MNYFYESYCINIDFNAPNKTTLLVDCIKKAIALGFLIPEQPLLSIKELSEKSKLGMTVIRYAYRKLEEQGFVTIKPGVGTYVTSKLTEWGMMKIESDFPIRPLRRAEILNGEQPECLKIGLKYVNPATNLKNHAYTTLDIVMEVLKENPEELKDYRRRKDEFKKVVQRKLISNLDITVPIENIALCASRYSLFFDLFKMVFSSGQIVILSSNADRLLVEMLTLFGLRLIFIPATSQGMCLKELEASLAYQKSIGEPVFCIYSNPYLDGFSNLTNIDRRRRGLYELTQQWGVLHIEEYGEGEFLLREKKAEAMVGEGNRVYKNVILIGTLSCLFAGMDRIHTLVSSEELIAKFSIRRTVNVSEFGHHFAIYKRMIKSGRLTKIQQSNLKKLDASRKTVMKAAGVHLSTWFIIKADSCGTSFWMVTKDPKGISLPLDRLKKESIELKHSIYKTQGLVKVQTIQVFIGYGDVDEIIEVFKVMNTCLS